MIAALLAELDTLRGQVLAFDRVIAVYDPSYDPTSQQTRPRKARQSNPHAQTLAAIGNKRQALLEALRDAGRPLSTIECAEKVGEQHGIAEGRRVHPAPS